MRPIDVIALVLVAAVAVGGRLFPGGGDDADAGRRPDPRQFVPRSPPPGPGFVITLDEKTRNSVGTAFSIDGAGAWITARHVTDGCDRIGIRRPNGRIERVRRVRPHRFADISVLWTRDGAPPLPLARPQAPVGGSGYSFGYPKGRPGDVHGRVIGHRRMTTRGRYSTVEPVVAWAHVARVPDRGPELGGISGGPWVDAEGDVVGVHVAGSRRRGRSFSTTPETLSRAIAASGVRRPSPGGGAAASGLSPASFPAHGDELRRRRSVAQVICVVD